MIQSRFGRRAIAAALAVIVLVADPVAAAEVEDAVAATDLTPTELVLAFDNARLPHVHLIAEPPAITGNEELDQHIRDLGEQSGYQRRGEAFFEELVLTDGYLLQPDAAVAWEGLQAAAAADGHSITLTSGYRNAARQAQLFNQRLTSTSDAAISEVLKEVAVPGYSKHHTGYAIDVRSGPYFLRTFGDSPVYGWLSADNWANAKAHGFLPSYPDGVPSQGPNPEPWEFVYMGAINILCGDYDPSLTGDQFCDIGLSTFLDDIRWLYGQAITTGCTEDRFCPDDTVTRGQAATFLFRLAGVEAPQIEIPFEDVEAGAFYADAVTWMTAEGITTGTSATEFSPNAPLTRAQFVTFLWRYAGEPAGGSAEFDDVEASDFFADAVAWAAAMNITTGTAPSEFSPDDTATRGQIAAFLHRFSLESTP